MVKSDSRSVQTEFGVVRFRDDFVFGFEGVDHDHWSEDLFFDYWRVFGWSVKMTRSTKSGLSGFSLVFVDEFASDLPSLMYRWTFSYCVLSACGP